MSHLFHAWEEYKGSIPQRAAGVMISSETGPAVPYAMFGLKDRGQFFVTAQSAVYKGMVVGEHCKDNDIDVNVCREKKLTNVRSSGNDKKLFLSPPKTFALEEALEYIEEDELVEVTPETIRIRKVALDSKRRKRSVTA